MRVEAPGLIRNIWTIGLMVGLARFISFGKELFVTQSYGLGPVLDSYSIALRIVEWLPVAMSDALTVLLVPILVREISQNKAQAHSVFAAIFRAVGLLGIAASLLIAVATLFASSSLTQRMVFSMSIVPLLSLSSCALLMYLNAIQNKRAYLFELFPPVAIAVAVAGVSQPDLEGVGLVIGTAIGFGLQAIYLFVLISGRVPIAHLSANVARLKDIWTPIRSTFVLLFFSQLFAGTTTFVDQFFLSAFEAGTISGVALANRLTAVFCVVGQLTMMRVILPVFSARLSQPLEETLAFAYRLIWAMIVGGLVVALTCSWFSVSIVGALFERGAFLPDQTAKVASFFSTGVFQLPAYLAAVVLAYLLHAFGKGAMVAWIGIGNILIKCLICSALVPIAGPRGVIIADVAVYLISLVALTMAVRVSLRET